MKLRASGIKGKLPRDVRQSVIIITMYRTIYNKIYNTFCYNVKLFEGTTPIDMKFHYRGFADKRQWLFMIDLMNYLFSYCCVFGSLWQEFSTYQVDNEVLYYKVSSGKMDWNCQGFGPPVKIYMSFKGRGRPSYICVFQRLNFQR